MKVLSGLDLNGNQITNVDTIIDGTENDIVKIGSNGGLVDSGVSISDIEPNVIESVSVNGTALTPTNKNVDIDLSDYVETTDERIIPTVTMNLSYDFDASEDVSGNRISNTSYSFPNDEVPNVQFAKLTLNMTCNVKLNGSVVMTSETTQNGWFNKHDILNTVSGEEETMNVIHITAPFFYGEAVVECEAIIAYQTLIIFEPNYWVNDAVQAGLAAFAEQLPPVATSGDYDDLLNRPDLSVFALSEDLATVATTGEYDDLLNKPELANVATSGSYEDLSDAPELANVATSGSYNDLSDTPDLSDYVLSENLASVATSGSYNDLEDRPNLTAVAAFFSLNIANEDNTDSFTFDATYISSDAIPIVQTVYDNKIVTDGIEVSFDPSTGSITVQWDDTKYDVNSNTPLTVSIVGAPTEREDS